MKVLCDDSVAAVIQCGYHTCLWDNLVALWLLRPCDSLHLILLEIHFGSFCKAALVLPASQGAVRAWSQSHGESWTESGAHHRLLLRDRPEDSCDAGQG